MKAGYDYPEINAFFLVVPLNLVFEGRENKIAILKTQLCNFFFSCILSSKHCL
jgi:hypothetical protein